LEVFTVRDLARSFTGGSGDDPNALFDAVASTNKTLYDAIVVDEGQDLSADWWLALENCLSEGKDSVFYVFHDTHQTLFSGGGILPDGMTEYALEDNVRNTQAICELLRAHYKGDVAISARGPAGRTVETVPYSTEQGFAHVLGKTINRLLTVERIRPADLIVLTPKSLDTTALTRLRIPHAIDLVAREPTLSKLEVMYAGIDQFKGLERKVAIVVELDEQLAVDPQRRDALLYVAFSRPRHHLILLGSPAALQQATQLTKE
jgi:hypothetical protein